METPKWRVASLGRGNRLGCDLNQPICPRSASVIWQRGN